MSNQHALSQSLPVQIARLVPPGAVKYQLEVHSPTGAIRIFPRKSEGCSFYSIRPFQSPRACPFGRHVIRFFDEQDRPVEVPNDAAPLVRLAPIEAPADVPDSDGEEDFFQTPAWDYIRREGKHQEIEHRSQQLLINQHDVNAHGEVTRAVGLMAQRQQEVSARAAQLSLDTQERITELSEKMLAMQQQFLEMGAAMVTTFKDVVERIKQPPPPPDWTGLAKTIFDGATQLGCTLIAAARMPETLPAGVVAAKSAKGTGATGAKEDAVKGPPRADVMSQPAEKPPIPAAADAVASLPPVPAKGDTDKTPPDPPAPPAASSGGAAPSAEKPAEPAADAKPAPTLRQRIRLACRRFVRYFLSFSPTEYVEMMEDPESLAEYIREMATLAVPPQELIAGLRT